MFLNLLNFVDTVSFSVLLVVWVDASGVISIFRRTGLSVLFLSVKLFLLLLSLLTRLVLLVLVKYAALYSSTLRKSSFADGG